MTHLRFIHTSDLHLGRPFRRYAAAARLTEARHAAVARLAAVAREQGALHVLVAGDLFETANPAPQTWRQALAAMAGADAVTWWLLPGNHDNLAEAEATWDGIAALGHSNVRVLCGPKPLRMQEGATLLPAPLATRHPTADPTAAMAAAETAPGEIRVGLAHGPVQGFAGEGEVSGSVIAPDRDRSAGLDYLALGDWHGQTRISERVRYSGAPELTGFRHAGRGACLAVEIEGPGAPPRVESVSTGRFAWADAALDLLPGEDAAAALGRVLPGDERRDTLVRVRAQGRARLAERDALRRAAAHLEPEFCHFELDEDGLALEHDVDDLDRIASSGALRAAAEALAVESGGASGTERERAVAAAALARLYALTAGERT